MTENLPFPAPTPGRAADEAYAGVGALRTEADITGIDTSGIAGAADGSPSGA